MSEGREKILIVDDDAFVRDMLGMVLGDVGYEVETAENGAEGLRLQESSPAGLIVSDMNMPEVDGLELITRLRKQGDDVPIVILTGNNEISTAIEAINRGAHDYLLKDENIQDTVIFSVEKVLEKHALRKQNKQLFEDLARKNERLENDRLLAQKVQKNLLPRKLEFDGFVVDTYYRPSDKIGGDFFDAWQRDGVVHFMLGDVSGHSTSSALIMAVAKGSLSSLGQSSSDPVEVVTASNRLLCEILSDGGMFLSLVYGTIIPEENRIRLLSAGHNPVFLTGGGSKVESVESMGPVMGWDADDEWDCTSYDFPPGAGLFLYTDGLTEAKNALGEEFGEERLQDIIAETDAGDGYIKTVLSKVEEFCGGEFADDLTMFSVLRRQV